MPSNSISWRINRFDFLLVIITMLVFASCVRQGDKERHVPFREEIKLDTLSVLLKYDNSLFPLPSPYQASSLVKQHGFAFDENLLNPTENLTNYTTVFKKALNLGVFGSNLSYLNIYDRVPQSINYLSTIKKITDDLNLTTAFDRTIFSRIEENIDNRDSLLTVIGRAYSDADSYLRINDRSEVGALILTGGWVESLYILTHLSQKSTNREIINRVGEQKHPLDNLIEVLSPYYYNSPEYSELIDMFIDLAYEFDGIIYSYSYREPRIDVDNKMIYINSESRVILSEYHLDAITQRIAAIRNYIIE